MQSGLILEIEKLKSAIILKYPDLQIFYMVL